jgi:hypothetical protein
LKQNITLTIEARLLNRALALAAQQGTSLSDFIASVLEKLVGEDQERKKAEITKEQEYQRAKACALALMARGFRLGGTGIGDRDALHKRPGLRVKRSG